MQPASASRPPSCRATSWYRGSQALLEAQYTQTRCRNSVSATMLLISPSQEGGAPPENSAGLPGPRSVLAPLPAPAGGPGPGTGAAARRALPRLGAGRYRPRRAHPGLSRGPALIPGWQAAVLRQEALWRNRGASYPLAPARALRLPRGNQVSLAAADQVGAAHALEGLAQQRPVVRVMVAQECLVQTPLPQVLGHDHFRAGPRHLVQRILAGMPHGRRGRHRACPHPSCRDAPR